MRKLLYVAIALGTIFLAAVLVMVYIFQHQFDGDKEITKYLDAELQAAKPCITGDNWTYISFTPSVYPHLEIDTGTSTASYIAESKGTDLQSLAWQLTNCLKNYNFTMDKPYDEAAYLKNQSMANGSNKTPLSDGSWVITGRSAHGKLIGTIRPKGKDKLSVGLGLSYTIH